MELGKKQLLKVTRKVDFGIYLSDGQEEILLPKNEVPQNIQVDQELDVFVMRDSKDRLIATTATPKVQVGEVACLEVREVTKYGAFLDWGMGKDLFLPYKEQTYKVREGEQVLVGVYLDKSNRICSTMKVYDYLSTDHEYAKDDVVSGYVYNKNPKFGTFVAVDNKYHGLIQIKELTRNVNIGDVVTARVAVVRNDGKLDLAIRKKAHLQMEEDAAAILEYMNENGGKIPYTDKASPERIREDFSMSKNEFKRAIGRLLKNNVIIIEEKQITLKK